MKNSFIKSVIYSYGSIIIIALIGFATLPLSLNYFGKDLFGLFSITNDTLAYLTLFNFGIPWAASVIFAKLMNYAAQKQLIVKSLLLLLMLSIMLLVMMVLINLFYPNWVYFISNIDFKITNVAKLFISISVVFFIIKLPFGLFAQLMIFINRVYIAKIIDVFAAVLNFVSLLCVIYLKLSLVEYALISGFISFIPLSIAVIVFFKIWSSNRIQNSCETSTNMHYTSSYRHLIGSSIYFFLNSIGVLVLWNTDSLIISHYLGLSETAEYAVLFRIFTMLFMVITQLMNVINPLYPKLIKESKFEQLTLLYSTMVRFFPIVGGVIFIVLFGLFKDFVVLWTHNNSIFIGYASCFALGLYCYFLCSSIIPYSAIVSLNYARNIFWLTLLEAVVNLCLSIYLVNKIGVAGVLFATLISHVVTMFVLVPRRLDKLMPNLFKFDFIYVFKHFILAIVPVSIMIYFLNLYEFGLLKTLLFIGTCIFYALISFAVVGKANIINIKYLLKALR